MENKYIEEKNIYEYIKDVLNSLKMKLTQIDDKDYHHNTKYEVGSSIIEHGILSLNDLYKLKLIKCSEDKLKLMADTDSHINGNDGISLSAVGLKDLYKDEEEYDPFYHSHLDFLVTRNIMAYRSTNHYGNEFISYNKISPNELTSLDIRLLKHIKESQDIENIIKKYNYLIDIANKIINNNLSIPIREMSNSEGFDIDINKLSKNQKIYIKNAH